jgi:hypothetical protein
MYLVLYPSSVLSSLPFHATLLGWGREFSTIGCSTGDSGHTTSTSTPAEGSLHPEWQRCAPEAHQEEEGPLHTWRLICLCDCLVPVVLWRYELLCELVLWTCSTLTLWTCGVWFVYLCCFVIVNLWTCVVKLWICAIVMQMQVICIELVVLTMVGLGTTPVTPLYLVWLVPFQELCQTLWRDSQSCNRFIWLRRSWPSRATAITATNQSHHIACLHRRARASCAQEG